MNIANIAEKNMQLLEKSKNFYGTARIEEPQAGQEAYVRYDEMIAPGQILMICNDIFVENLMLYEEKSYIFINYRNEKLPFYVYYEEPVFDYVAANFDLSCLLGIERVVLIVGKAALRAYFEDYDSIFPNTYAGFQYGQIKELVEEARTNREEALEAMRRESEAYYELNEDKIKKRIKDKRFSVLFLAYEYDLFDKYYKRYCEAIDKSGLEIVLVGEEDCVKRICTEYVINLYKPDLVLTHNFFRTDCPGSFPSCLVLTTILEDPRVPQYLSDYYKNLGKNDLIISAFTRYKRLRRTLFGNETWREIPMLMTRTDWPPIYQPPITEAEHEKYDCDVCFICAQVDFLPLSGTLMTRYLSIPDLSEELGLFITKLYEDQYLDKNTIIGKDMLEKSVYKLLAKYQLSEEQRVDIFWTMYNIKYLIDRYVMLQWILREKRYTVNIWGFGGLEVKEFQSCARGKWQNEREKYLAISCARVVVQNEAQSGLVSPKFSEVMANGSMMLAEYADASIEISEYNKYYQEGGGVSLYKNRTELLQKIDYYISHEKERSEIIERGKELVAKKLNYTIAIEEWIGAVSEKFV